MRGTVDRLVADSRRRYGAICEEILCEIWSDHGNVELRFGFSLRDDHILRRYKTLIPADEALTDLDRAQRIAVAFVKWHQMIESAVAPRQRH